MDPQQLSQLEALCERLYISQEPNERAHAEQVMASTTEEIVKTLSKLHVWRGAMIDTRPL